jgi:hypothetical protein
MSTANPSITIMQAEMGGSWFAQIKLNNCLL